MLYSNTLRDANYKERHTRGGGSSQCISNNKFQWYPHTYGIHILTVLLRIGKVGNILPVCFKSHNSTEPSRNGKYFSIIVIPHTMLQIKTHLSVQFIHSKGS